MKKFVRHIVAFALVVSLGISVSVTNAYAFDVVGAVSLVVSCIQSIKSASDASKAAEDARLTILHHWINTNETTDATWIEVDGDTLASAVYTLSSGGQPCKLQQVSHMGYTVYVLVAVSEPFNLSNGQKVMSNSKITGCYFGSQQLYTGTEYPTVNKRYVFYSLYPSSPSSLDKIRISLQGLVTSLGTHLNKIEGYIDGIEGYIDGIESALSTTNSRLNTLIGHVDGIEGYIDQIEGRMIKTAGGSTYTLADLAYNAWQRLVSIDSRLSTANGYLSNLDTVVDLLTETHYMCSYLSDSSGNDYPTYAIPYASASDLVYRLNSVMVGRQVYLLSRDGSGVSSSVYYVRRASLTSTGYIRIVAATSSGMEYTYYLCDAGNNLYVAGQDYPASIYSRLSDVISAINSMSVDVDMSGVQLSLDGSNINLWNNNAYCCGYLTDANGNDYPTIQIPYDTAVDMLSRFNTDYVGQSISALSRSGSVSTRYLRSASLTASGYIRVTLTNGYNYYLCDNTNSLYFVSSGSNYGSSVSSLVSDVNAHLTSFDTSFEDYMTNIENALSNLNDTAAMTLEEIQNIHFPDNNTFTDVWNVGTDDNGNDKTIFDTSVDLSRLAGKLLSFLYDLCFRDALSNNGLGDLRDFYLDTSEGVDDLWGS